jgi:hypothetical protein
MLHARTRGGNDVLRVAFGTRADFLGSPRRRNNQLPRQGIRLIPSFAQDLLADLFGPPEQSVTLS